MKIATSDSFRQIVVIAAITFAGSCLMPNALGQQQAGYVLEINGQWVLSGHGQLAQGQSVPAGGVVNAQSAAADDRIVIVNRNGEIVARRHCRNSGECARPIKLPMPVSESSTLSIFVSSVMSLLSGEPDRYSIHRKRDEDFPDAVVKLDGQQLDLTPIFKMKGPRNFYVRLRAIRRQAEPAAKWIGPITLAWNPDRPAIAKLPDAQPGLYELALLERDGDDYLPTGTSAWVLLASPATYSETSAAYLQALALTQKWGNDVTPEGARSFLRAQLDRLARQNKR